MTDSLTEDVLDHVNKRLTLNLLVQGSAEHAFLTAHHLVRDELTQIDDRLVPLYDRFAVAAFLGYWYGDLVLICGRPRRFWASTHKPDHPFHRHPLLAHHGGELAEAARKYVVERGKLKGVTRLAGWLTCQSLAILWKVWRIERRRKAELIDLAKRATHLMWGIDEHRLDGKLTGDVEFSTLRTPKTMTGKLLRAGAAGYGGVMRYGDELTVVARAWVWPLLVHELVKGTTELVCLHGLNTLDEDMYRAVVDEADHIEHETWHLQVGSELWRRFLKLRPDNRPLADVVMRVAQLPPKPLEHLMMAIVERPDWARELIAAL